MTELRTEVRDAYEQSAASWEAGPALVYAQLARALIERTPVPLAGRLALDLGTGTGVASAVLAERGARVVAIDLAEAMVRHRRRQRPPGVVGDALSLPFRPRAFDVVVAPFSINHVSRPEQALAEAGRVAHAGGAVVASSFPVAHEHPAKARIEAVLHERGWVRPGWYEEFKTTIAERTGSVAALRRAAGAAGLVDVDVVEMDVEAGLDDPRLLVEYRLGMPHTLGFVESLSAERRAELHHAATAAVGTDLPSALPVLILVARAA